MRHRLSHRFYGTKPVLLDWRPAPTMGRNIPPAVSRLPIPPRRRGAARGSACSRVDKEP